MTKTHALTQERLKELLHYDPETGVFAWRVGRRGMARAGSVAGTEFRPKRRRTTYINISIDGVNHKAHQLAWLYIHGERAPLIDHRKGNGLNNRISNLKLATSSQNNSNVSKQRNNTSGFKGVYKSRSRWKAQIGIDRKVIYLGTFDTPEEAHAAYCAAAVKYHGEFAHF